MPAHLIFSEKPLTEFRTYEAICGHLTFYSKFALMWDDQHMGNELELSALLVCRKCLAAAREKRKEQPKAQWYVYGLVEKKPHD